MVLTRGPFSILFPARSLSTAHYVTQTISHILLLNAFRGCGLQFHSGMLFIEANAYTYKLDCLNYTSNLGRECRIWREFPYELQSKLRIIPLAFQADLDRSVQAAILDCPTLLNEKNAKNPETWLDLQSTQNDGLEPK